MKIRGEGLKALN